MKKKFLKEKKNKLYYPQDKLSFIILIIFHIFFIKYFILFQAMSLGKLCSRKLKLEELLPMDLQDM
jgi:hypothetical protein